MVGPEEDNIVQLYYILFLCSYLIYEILWRWEITKPAENFHR